jgi:arginase
MKGMEHYDRVNQFLLTPFFLDRRASSLERLAAPRWRVIEPLMRDGDQLSRMGDVHDALAKQVRETAATGDRVVNIGADCCQTIAVMAGLRRTGLDPVLVWLDAHGDFNTWETSPSGFVGGMPLAMLVGRGDQRLLERLALPPMPETDVVLSDARDLDPEERIALQGSRVSHVTRVDELLARIPAGRPLYVHLDVDILDADEAPAMLYPVRGGPSAAGLARVASSIRESGRLVAVSVTAWELDRDPDRVTERACLQVLNALIAPPGDQGLA